MQQRILKLVKSMSRLVIQQVCQNIHYLHEVKNCSHRLDTESSLNEKRNATFTAQSCLVGECLCALARTNKLKFSGRGVKAGAPSAHES